MATSPQVRSCDSDILFSPLAEFIRELFNHRDQLRLLMKPRLALKVKKKRARRTKKSVDPKVMKKAMKTMKKSNQKKSSKGKKAKKHK